jgi:2'-hydroxyisoflavone reductase
LIVGPGDESDRFTYWPVRVERGGEVMAPGKPTDPVQFIDARDLAEWIIRMAEQGTTGVFNATGPKNKLGVGGMLDGIKKATKSNAQFTWVPAGFLAEHKVRPWSDMPVWIPPKGEETGFAEISIKKALAKGLRFRTLPDTTQATLAWFKQQTAERQAKLRAGITAEKEKEVLAAWHATRKA